MPGADRWAGHPPGATLVLCDPGTGLVLAYMTPPRGSGPGDALAALDTIAPLLALLPPGAHPIPVN